MNEKHTQTYSKTDIPTESRAVQVYKPDTIYLPFDAKRLRQIKRRRRMITGEIVVGKLIIYIALRMIVFGLLIGSAVFGGYLCFVFVIAPVLDFIIANLALIGLAIGLLIALFFLALIYPEFRANRCAQLTQNDFHESTTTVQTTRHEGGVTIHNIITIQNNSSK